MGVLLFLDLASDCHPASRHGSLSSLMSSPPALLSYRLMQLRSVSGVLLGLEYNAMGWFHLGFKDTFL
jgi:hypothetical protein